jgi:hypothetical protein
MAYIANETPAGVINGVNTTFTLADTVYQIVLVTVDGVIYTGYYSEVGSVITLSDAPTVSITVSYYTSNPPAPVGSYSTPILVSAARTALENRKRDITDVTSTVFVQWCDFVNKYLYRQLFIADPERFIALQTYTISAAPQTHALPGSFENIEPLGTGFFIQNQDGTASSQTLVRTGYGSGTPGYYINGNNVVFTGIQNQTVVLRYIPQVITLTATTEYFTTTGYINGSSILDTFYLSYVVNALDVLYTIWDAEALDEAYADQRFVRALNDIVTTIRKEPTAFAIDDYTLYF